MNNNLKKFGFFMIGLGLGTMTYNIVAPINDHFTNNNSKEYISPGNIQTPKMINVVPENKGLEATIKVEGKDYYFKKDTEGKPFLVQYNSN